MATLSSIKRLHQLIIKNTLYVDPSLDYDRIIKALGLLGQACADYRGESEDWLYIGESTITADCVIVGGYWHLYEWHGGQYSDSYQALCSLGQVFNPGMTSGCEPDSMEFEFFNDLNNLAR